MSRHRVDNLLFGLADFLGRPPGFYVVIAAMAVSTILLPFGLTDVVTYLLSVAAIVITGVVLIQGYRDTAAIHAKLDEIIVAMRKTDNAIVGLEHENPADIRKTVELIEQRALATSEAGEQPTGESVAPSLRTMKEEHMPKSQMPDGLPTGDNTAPANDVADPHPSTEEHYNRQKKPGGARPPKDDLGPNDAIHHGTPGRPPKGQGGRAGNE